MLVFIIRSFLTSIKTYNSYYYPEYRGKCHNDGHRDGFDQRERQRSNDTDVERQIAGVQRATESTVLHVQVDGETGGKGGEDGEGRRWHRKNLFGDFHGRESLS